jgi:hypothetical protein
MFEYLRKRRLFDTVKKHRPSEGENLVQKEQRFGLFEQVGSLL